MKIRSSMLYSIMIQPKLKRDQLAGELAQTGKSYIEEMWVQNTTGRKKVISTPAMEKGIKSEAESIQLLSDYFGLVTPFEKNEISLENDYITGTCDILTSDSVIDIKTSFDLFTFPHFMRKIPNSYYWQLQAYMWLYGRESAQLAYCLVNTPESLFERLVAKKTAFTADEDLEGDWYDDFYNIHHFDDLPLNQRVKIFDVERNESDIARIPEQVEKARKYYDNL